MAFCYSRCVGMTYLLSWLAFNITNDVLRLSNNLIHNFLSLCPRLLDSLHVRTGGLLWCCSRFLGRSSLLGSSCAAGSLGFSNAARSYFAGAGLRCVGLGGRAAFCRRDCVLNLLNKTGLRVAFVNKSVCYCVCLGMATEVLRRGGGQYKAVCEGGRKLTSSRARSCCHLNCSRDF
jgi:hypothetical protein